MNLSTATEASDSDLTENGVTFRAKVMALNTVTTVKAWMGNGKGHLLSYQTVNR